MPQADPRDMQIYQGPAMTEENLQEEESKLADEKNYMIKRVEGD